MAILDHLLRHQTAAAERLYLVPSENSPSITARMAFLTDVVNRYYFPLEKTRQWAFPGNEHIEKIYAECTRSLREITGAKFVSLKPVSGASAMTIALASLAKIGDTVASIAPDNGGHTITAPLMRRLGLRSVYLPYDQEAFSVDTGKIAEFIEREGVSLIYFDQPHVLFSQALSEIRKKIPSIVRIYYDGSHTLGLIFGQVLPNPLLEGADFLGGSTHKTIPGPHKGFIATNSELGYRSVEDHGKMFVSHDHGGDVAALAMILEEMSGRWGEYASQTVKNAQYLAKKLNEKGFTVIGKERGFTESHQIWIDTNLFREAFDAVMDLSHHNIIVNTISVPAITDRLLVRIGVQEVTYCGAKEETMDMIADIFEDILIKKHSSMEAIKQRVAEMKKHLSPPFDDDVIEKIMTAITSKAFS